MRKHGLLGFGWVGLVVVIGLAGCGQRPDRVAVFMPGRYVRSVAGEFSTAADTLQIARVNKQAYTVTRRTGYRAVREGKLLPLRRQVRVYQGNYDSVKQVLYETTNGRMITFVPDSGLLRVNGAVYRKLP